MIWILWNGQPYFLCEPLLAWQDPVDRPAILALVAGYLDAAPGDVAGLAIDRLEDGSLLVRPADVSRHALPDFSGALGLYRGCASLNG